MRLQVSSQCECQKEDEAAAARPENSPAPDDAKERESLRRQAREEGFREGYEAGMRAARAEAERILHEAEREVEEAKRIASDIYSEYEPMIIELAVHIAERIIRTEMAQRPEVVLAMARAAVSKLRGEGRLVVRVNPRDTVLMEEARLELKAEAPHVVELSVEEDPSLETGDFMLESSRGSVDARIARQIERVVDALREARERGGISSVST
ncbi:MAG: FliH/SctL family protein [Bacillota bacterium]